MILFCIMEYYIFTLYSVAIFLFTSILIVKLLSSNTNTNSNSNSSDKYNKPDRRPLPPSPLSLPILGHLHLFKKPLHRTLARLSSSHGPLLLLRFGSRPVLVVSSLPLAEQCFTKNDIAFANRPQLLSSKSLSYNYTTLSSAPYGPHWRNIRRIATVELLSSARLQSSSDVRSSEVMSLVRSLFREYCSNDDDEQYFKTVELKPMLFGLAYNVMMRMIAGKRYYGEGAEGSEEARRFNEMVVASSSMAGASNVSDFLPLLRAVDFGGVKEKMRRLVEKREATLQGLIDEQRKKGVERDTMKKKNKNKNMLEVLMALQAEAPEYYSDESIKAMIVTLFFAATDTSPGTMEWAMTLLLNHPEALHKAKEEIDSRVEKGRLLQEHDLPNLPYLQAIFTETLRLCPPTPLLLPHESFEECTVGGYRIPPGTMLLVNTWVIHRDPAEWADPTEFRPERFMVDGGEGGGGGTKILPFGMGRRRCPGDGLATKLIGLALGTMIQCFEWGRIGEELVDMEGTGGLSLHKMKPLLAMYRPHQAMVDVLSQI